MRTDEYSDDIRAIEALVARQFASVNWTPGTTADWPAFSADFFPEASLYPGARPAQCQTVPAFIVRMGRLAETTLRTFREAVLGTEVQVFGNIATALVVCEMTENETEAQRNVEMLLLVKSDNAWRIVSQAWDTESPSKPISSRLLTPIHPVT